jgi:hypothetical protein
MLPEPADHLQIRYLGRPGVNGIRVNIHSVRPSETPDEAVTVIHGFEIDGELHEKRLLLDGPSEYTIECSKEPRNVFIRMEVPNR